MSMPLTKHGMTHTPTWTSWKEMKQRCNNPRVAAYHRYGGRGICYCEEWEEFTQFFADMGERPRGTSLDRINNDKDYSPENCRWATHKEQCANTEKAILIQHNGETHCAREWSRRTGIGYGTIAERIKRGWSAHRALTTPVRTYRRRRRPTDGDGGTS